MCGRFTLTTTPEELALEFGLSDMPVLAPRFNIAPSQPIATISNDPRSARRLLVPRRWGLIPSWAKDPKIGNRMINARVETLAEKPAFREAFQQRRCLVPADGFFEWAAARPGGARQPHHIALPQRRCFAIAGLWERWRDPAGASVESCTLLTTEALPGLRALHDRMPVILAPADYALWLAPEAPAAATLHRIALGAPAAALAWHPVGKQVNDPRVDDPTCLAPVVVPPERESQLLLGGDGAST
jgi:putative SOS response-associated peptidase YedK